MKHCSIDGCDKPHLAKDLCESHYRKKWRKANPDYKKEYLRNTPPCRINGCQKNIVAIGLCDMHRARFKRYGDVNKTKRHNHGLGKEAEYRIWCGMKTRCYNPNTPAYERYGGRGIKVCERWLKNFNNFYEDMGARPGLEYSIDRINNDGNYEPDNCKWATNHEQAGNTRRNNEVPGIRVRVGKNRTTWYARLNHKGKQVFYKRCASLEEAIAARRLAEIKYLGSPDN